MEHRIEFYNCQDPQKTVAQIFHCFADWEGFGDLKYFSYDALVQLYLGTYQLTREYFKKSKVVEELSGGKRGKVTRWLRKGLNISHFPKTREGMFSRIFEDIFKGFGCGRLHGYGTTNQKIGQWKS